MRTKSAKFRWLKQLNIDTQQKFDLVPLSLRDSSALKMRVSYLIQVDYTVVEDLAIVNFALSLIIEALDQLVHFDVAEVAPHVFHEVLHQLLIPCAKEARCLSS